MIEEFEVGKYYRWIGPDIPKMIKNHQENFLTESWNHEGGMDPIVDGQVRKCIKASGFKAIFENMPSINGFFQDGMWYWNRYLNFFEEVGKKENKQYLLEFNE